MTNQGFLPEDIDVPTFLKNQEAYFDIQREIQNNPFGMITLSIRVHQGQVTEIVHQTWRRKRFTKPEQKPSVEEK